jgi:hypothetical protein
MRLHRSALADGFETSSRDVLELSFVQVDEMVGGLPPAAYG